MILHATSIKQHWNLEEKEISHSELAIACTVITLRRCYRSVPNQTSCSLKSLLE